MRYILIICAALWLCFSAAIAQDTVANKQTEIALEHRAREVGHALRCVVCQNQSIEESNASLAEDMRRLVRARIKAGDSNTEVIAYMQDRYGDYVLLKPPVQSNTYILWFGPFILALLGIIWFLRQSRKTAAVISAEPLTREELEDLGKLGPKP